MKRKLLTVLLCIALLFGSISTSGMQAFASEAELITEGTTDLEDNEETTDGSDIEEAEQDLEKSYITINRMWLCVGKNIEIENTKGYKIKWYVDDEFVSEDNYAPTEKDYESWIKAEAYGDNDELVCEDSVYFSKLPVVYIDTEDRQAITDKVTYRNASMFIQNNEEVDSAVYDNSIQIKGRGNSSWGVSSKKPYKIKLGKKTDFYGMGKNKHWVLIANYWDECLMRNTIAYNLSKELGLINMETVWVDVILNGEYVGNYQLCEHIRVGDSRVDIADWKSEAEDIVAAIYKAEKSNGMSKEASSELEDLMEEDLSWISSGKVEYSGTEYDISTYVSDWNKDITGGYIFEMSDEYDEVSKFRTSHGLKVMLNSPEFLYTNDEMMEYVQEYWQAFEDAYFAEDGYADYNGETVHYSELADFDSMVGYWLTMEIMGNNDAWYKSRFAYKDRGDKIIFGPAWDFDYGCGSSAVGRPSDGWKLTLGVSDQNFWAEFVDDPYFIQKASEKYWSIRPYLESLISDGGILDEDYAYLYESGMANSAMWFFRRGFEEDFQIFKNYMKTRMEWLDIQFDTEESIIESLGKYSSSDKFEIIQTNTNKDETSAHAAAQGVLMDSELVLKVNILSEDISEFRIFINGLKHKSIILTEADKDSVEIAIPADALMEKSEGKNVITIQSVGVDGEYSGSNFTTVIKSNFVKGTPYIVSDDELSYSVDAPHVIINQIYGADDDGYCSHSFIEIYNPTDSNIRLNGWALYYQSALGGNDSGEWEKLELQGTINAYSSYLIRCQQVTEPENVVYEVPKGDAEWSDLRMDDQGGTVLLSYRHNDISESADIYDNDAKAPLIEGYVDMLSVSQSPQKAIRRIAFTDTDNHSVENGDCEMIDYSFKVSQYIEWAAPRNAESGEWHASAGPKYTVTMYKNDGTDAYETAEITYTDKVTGLTEPEREGYMFDGWYEDPECEIEFDFDETPVSDIVLYAGWNADPQSVSIEEITDGSLFQSVNTIKEYRVQLDPESIPYSAIAMETSGLSGIKAEFEGDSLKIDTTDAVVGDSLSVKFYNTVISTDRKRFYIDGGNFTINVTDPTLFINSIPEVSVKGIDDVSVTLFVSEPQEIENFVSGVFYYKLEAVPHANAKNEIPHEIESATAHPIYLRANGEKQKVEMVLNDAEYGKGQNWRYDIKVSLLLTTGETLPNELGFTDTVLYTSKENCLTDIETRMTDVGNGSINFDLQPKKTIIYTAQSDIVVAEVLWNEAQVINELGEVRDITAIGKGTTGGNLTVSAADGKIIVSAPKGTEPGVHTIEVISYGPDKSYKVRKTMSVIVLKGIETLDISVPTTRIYRQNGKQVQIKASLSYNDGGTEPKLKKVVWQITDTEGNLLDSSSPLYGMIKVSDGKVVIDKNLVLAKESEKNCFRIMVQADDYSENEVYALSDVIEISDSKLTIGDIVLLRYNPENKVYETIDASKPLTADVIDNAVIVSLVPDSPNKAEYTIDELREYRLPCNAVQYKSSKSKLSIAIADDNAVLHAGPVTGKVTITATATDGGKQKSSIKLNLIYAKPAEMAVAMQDKNSRALRNSDAKEVSFTGTTNTVISLQVNAKASVESEWEPLWAYTNYTLKISGGKILESDSLKGVYDIVVTGEKAIITLTDKENKVKKTYTLTNNAYSKLAAPKIKQTGTLSAGSLNGRSITFKLGGSYDYTGKSVMIETDATQKTSKNKKAYYYTNLENASGSLGECSAVSPDGSITVKFDSTFIYASSYKLKMTFGVIDENGVFIADAKPVSQTLKVKAAKAVKGSFKLITSYNMKANAGESVLLTGTGKEIKGYDVKKLTNATSKGTENKFTDYFQISGNQLCLKTDLSADDTEYLKSKAGKKELTGYVTYTAYHGDNGYGEPYVTVKTVKVTIKLTDF